MRICKDNRRANLVARILARPSSRLGRVSTCLFVASIVLIVGVNALGVKSIAEIRFGSSRVFNISGGLIFACVLAAGITGLVAVVRKQERSWAVLLPSALSLTVIGAEILELIVLLLP